MIIRRHLLRRENILRKISMLLTFSLGPALVSQQVHAGSETKKPKRCLFSSSDLGLATCNSSVTLDTKFLDLESVFEKDKDGFPVWLSKYPLNVMSAAQIMLSMIKSQPENNRVLFGGRTVRVFDLFSKMTKVNNNKVVIGQYEGIDDVVRSIESRARRPGAKVPLLVGEPGTGKSEFLEVFANALKYMTTNHEKYFMFDIEWKVSELRKIPNLTQHTKLLLKKEYRSIMHPSPFSLADKEIQEALQERLAAATKQMTGMGSVPIQALKPDPMSADFRREILEYFATSSDPFVVDTLKELEIEERGAGRAPLLRDDEIPILSRFVNVRRLVLGDHGSAPFINAQNDDVDWSSIFVKEDPAVSSLPGESVWKFNYDGLALGANRNILFLDEYFAGSHEFRTAFLPVFQSGKVQISGSPVINLDAVYLLASNTADLLKEKSNPRSRSQLDRMNLISFEWHVHPGDIARTVLYMNGDGIKMQKLQTEEAPWETLDIAKLIPDQLPNRPLETPDYRYALQYGSGSDAVHIAPHTLMFLADFTAATRMKTDRKEALDRKANSQVARMAIFDDPLMRLRALKGLEPVDKPIAADLYDLSRKLNEGSFGLSARSVGTWFSEAISEARMPENKNTLTPLLLRQVYTRLFEQKHASKTPQDVTPETLLEWRNLMDKVVAGVLIPTITPDINGAQLDDEKIGNIYDDVMSEIVARSENPGTKVWGEDRVIEEDRLLRIKQIYQERNSTPLDYGFLAQFYRTNRVPSGGSPRHQGLLRAIVEYQGEQASKMVTIADLLECAKGQGKRDVQPKWKSASSKMMEMGYNPKSVIDAMSIVQQHKQRLAAEALKKAKS